MPTEWSDTTFRCGGGRRNSLRFTGRSCRTVRFFDTGAPQRACRKKRRSYVSQHSTVLVRLVRLMRMWENPTGLYYKGNVFLRFSKYSEQFFTNLPVFFYFFYISNRYCPVGTPREAPPLFLRPGRRDAGSLGAGKSGKPECRENRPIRDVERRRYVPGNAGKRREVQGRSGERTSAAKKTAAIPGGRASEKASAPVTRRHSERPAGSAAAALRARANGSGRCGSWPACGRRPS